MEEVELHRLLRMVQSHRCETQTTEVKTAQGGCPSKLYGTLSAFSNQDGGGVILFGLDESERFEAVGVYDPQDLQHRVAEQCKQMQPAVRPLFTVCDVAGRIVVSAEIPGVDVTERPVYYKGVGRVKGSFVRVGEADEPMSDYEIYSFDAYRRRVRDDIRPAEFAEISQLDDELLSRYLVAVRKNKPNAAKLSDDEVLGLMGIVRDGGPTLAGVLCFSKYPQAAFPQLCVTAVVVPGLQMGNTGPSGERFTANNRIEGTIEEMLDEAVLFVERNMRVKTIIDENGKRADKTEYPVAAVREAILNALVHRDYSIHTEGAPVRILMFNDRLEIRNEGGLYGRATIDSLGKIHADTRNQTLANILEVTRVVENRYSGIPTIRAEMARYGLPAPVFENSRGYFSVTLKNDYAAGQAAISDHAPLVRNEVLTVRESATAPYRVREEPTYLYENPALDSVYRYEDPVRDSVYRYGMSALEATDILSFCKRPRTRKEIADFFGKTQYYAMKTLAAPLLEAGKLKMTIPNRPKSRNQRYYSE